MKSQTNDLPVDDAQVVADTTAPDTDPNAAQVLIDMEQMIKTNITRIDKSKTELKKLREMITSALENDETYRLHNDEAKKAAKQKAQTKFQLMQQPVNKELSEKIKTLQDEMKEADGALSDYLREYQRMSGSNEIETDDGEVREIVYVAKLVKKSSRVK